MPDDKVSATSVIHAPADVVFSMLADPATHVAIDGTGHVHGPVDTGLLEAAGQVFRMAMYHEDHPDGDYETANRVRVFERLTAISWETGYDPGGGDLRFGGWWWRYDLAPGRAVPDRGQPVLRLVGGPRLGPRVSPLPAIRATPPRRVACTPGRPRRHLRSHVYREQRYRWERRALQPSPDDEDPAMLIAARRHLWAAPADCVSCCAQRERRRFPPASVQTPCATRARTRRCRRSGVAVLRQSRSTIASTSSTAKAMLRSSSSVATAAARPRHRRHHDQPGQRPELSLRGRTA
jgi:hypothetical protein